MTKKIPIISLQDFEAKAKKPVMMKSLVLNIADGINEKLDSVNIAEIKNYEINIFVYPFTVFFPRIATFITKKLEYTWLEKINFFSRGFLISTKK